MSIVLSCAGMRPLKVWAAHQFRQDDSQPRKATRFVRRKHLRRSCACATVSYLADLFRVNAGCARAPSLFDRENVPRANVQITAPPPTANARSYTQQIVPQLRRTLPESSELHDRSIRG